jgi:isochorismate synthase
MEVKFLRLANQDVLPDLKGVFVLPSEFRGEVGHCMSREDYCDLVAKAVNEMKNGAFQKVALSRCIAFPDKGISTTKAVGALNQRFPHLTVFHFVDEKGQEWLGATPELLFQKRGNRYRTISLAGTRIATSQDTNWGKKEIEEQALVTNYIQKVIAHLGGYNFQASEAKTFQSGSIEHLRSEISFIYDGHWKEVMSTLHPTSAVAGMPVASAFPFIQKNEPHDREFYTGLIGVEQEGNVDVYVLLRMAKAIDGQFVAFVGAGITKDSDPTSEANEIEAKAHSFLTPIFEMPS